MQSVAAGFTAEARDSVRQIAQNTRISWHRQSTLGNRTFTIGVSSIGGNDIIGVNPGSIGSPGIYRYFDESAYVTSLGWERGLNMPLGGISKAMAEIRLDNTSGRFTPRYMGGNSELSTAILPRRPVLINAGFKYGGVDITLPQFAGVTTEIPQLDQRSKDVQLKASDYMNYFENKYVDKTTMYTAQRSDVILANLLTQAGMSTAQYDLDQGIQNIGFLIAPVGTKFSDLIHELVQAENGQFYQDESGIFKFENRQHWTNAPYTTVIQTVYTADVLDSYMSNRTDSHLINVVEVRANPLTKTTTTTIFTQAGTIELSPGDNDIFVEFANPVLQASTPVRTANTLSTGLGTDVTSSVTLKNASVFAQNAKYTYTNSSGATAYITSMTIQGRWATPLYTDGIYYRAQDDSSVTAYQERPLSIQNNYIQSQSWAASFANLILSQYSDLENLQTIVIRAKPYLQLGDLISWQGHYWRIFDIKNQLDPSVGFTQELTLLQRNTQTYFRIGISRIGGSDVIAP
jgi:hypothetical protein